LDEAIYKADILVEALSWIRKFHETTLVIKLGGSVMEDDESLRHVLLDIVFMQAVGMRPVIVHGGGAAISRAMDEAGIEPRFVLGRRYTDGPTLEIVERVLAGEVNQRIADLIEELGGRAMTLNFESSNVLYGEPLALEVDGEPADLGFVGAVTRVDRMVIENLCYAGQIPIIPSMCVDADGQKYNVNADTAATSVAETLRADKLIFLSDVNGVRRDKDDPSSLIPTLTPDEARELIENGTIAAGMIPKVEACIDTLSRGVRKVHIIDGRLRHSLILEIYTSDGIGTQMIASRPLIA
jgi:acetylglutamate kinase